MTFEHNSNAHAQITQRFFAHENSGFFTELCYPDQLSTLTWNNTAAESNLDDLLDNLGHHFYTTVFVENIQRAELVLELEQQIKNIATHLQGTSKWKEREGAYIAVWEGTDHSLVGVCSSLRQVIQNPKTSCWFLSEEYHDELNSTLNEVQKQCEDGANIPVQAFLGLLEQSACNPNFMRKWIEELNDPTNALLVQEWEHMKAKQQKQTLQQAVGAVNAVGKRKVL